VREERGEKSHEEKRKLRKVEEIADAIHPSLPQVTHDQEHLATISNVWREE